jgi:hypothetical protein
VNEAVQLSLSFWLNQATILFVLGCHTLAGWALWASVGRWGKALTISSASVWITIFMRLVVQIRMFQAGAGRITQKPPYLQELFFWSVAGFLCALAVGYVLRQTMLALVSGAYQRE